MILLPIPIRVALTANSVSRRLCDAAGERFDPVPLLKLFNPLGPATWLASELDADGDTLFGLADLGFGCPELGSFSVAEIAALQLPFGLRIERDTGFATSLPLSAWAAAARHAGSILHAEAGFRRAAASGSDPDRSPSPSGAG